MRKSLFLILAAVISATPVATMAGDGRDVVIGSIIGGATGAIIGNNLGGRDGAIVGGAIGAAAGVAIATDPQRNDGYNRYENRRDERYDRYGRRDDGYARYENDRRHDRHDDRRHGYQREVVVVESPRHYYQGNDFVYGVPPRHDNGRHQGWQQGRRNYDRGGNVIIIQQDDGRYCPPPRRW